MTFFDVATSMLALFALTLVLASVFVWIIAARQLWMRQPMLPIVPREHVPWGFDAVAIAIGLLVLLASLASFGVQRLGLVDVTDKANEASDAVLSLSDMSTLMTVEGASRIVALICLVCWLLSIYRARWSDLGMEPRWSDMLTGLLGVVALLPPVYVLQALLTELWVEYEHPVLDLLEESGDPTFLIPMATIACFVAPLTEEFFFRVILQGWLERVGTSKNTTLMSSRIENEEFEVSDEANTRIPYWPIFVASFFFAMVHMGQGPAPVTLFCLSIGLGYLYRQTHSLWPSLIVHFALNAITMMVAALKMIAGEGAF